MSERKLRPKTRNNGQRMSVQRMPLVHGGSSTSVSLDIHGTSETLNFSDRVKYWETKLAERTLSGRPRLTLNQAQKILAAFSKTQTATSLGELSEFVDAAFIGALDEVVYWYALHFGEDEKMMVSVLVQIYVYILQYKLPSCTAIVNGSVPAIYFALAYANSKEVAVSVAKVLNALCSYGFEQRQLIFTSAEAFQRCTAERCVFQTLMDLFRHSKDEDIVGEVASFFAAVTCTSDSAFSVVAKFQRALLDLDIHDSFKKVLALLKENSSSNTCIRKVEQAYSEFANNVIKTHKACVIEKSSGTNKDLDISNTEDVWNFVCGNAVSFGYEQSLLNVLSALVYVPTDQALARAMLTTVVQVVNELTCEAETDTGGTRKKEYNPLDSTAFVSLATERLERTKQVQKASDKDEAKIMKKKIAELQAENENLKEKLASGGGRAASKIKRGTVKKKGTSKADKGGSNAQAKEKNTGSPGKVESSKTPSQETGGGGGTRPNPTIMRPKVPAGKLDSTGLQPAGPLSGVPPQEIPPCPESGQPGSLDQAPVKVLEEGERALTPEEKAERKRKEKEEKLKAHLEKEARMLKELGMKELQPMQIVAKLKALHWKKLAVSELKGTVWVNLDQTGAGLDIPSIVEKYVTAKKARATTSKKTDTKPEAINIDQGRMILARSINQTLSKLNSGYSIGELVQNVNPVLFELPNLLMMLVALTPTAEQLEQVQQYNSNPSKYQKIEAEDKVLFKDVCEIDRFGDRVDLLSVTSRSFFASAKQIEENIALLEGAFDELMSSQAIKILLEAILAFGNVLNHGTSHGGAYGVDISSLVALNSHKDNDGQPTLRHLAAWIMKKQPSVTSAEFPKCEESLNSPTVSEILTSIKQLSAIKGRVAKKKLGFQNDASDVFFNYLIKFEERAAEPIKTLKAKGNAIKKKYKQILSFFPACPADKKDIESRQLISIFLDLYKSFKVEFERAVALEAAIQRANTTRSSRVARKSMKANRRSKKYKKPTRKERVADSATALLDKHKKKLARQSKKRRNSKRSQMSPPSMQKII